MSKLLFVYGTLMEHSLREKLFKKEIPHKKATVLNMKKVGTNETKLGATIKNEKGAEVSGLVLEVNEQELKILDDWETKHTRLKVRLSDGRVAWTYLLNTDSHAS